MKMKIKALAGAPGWVKGPGYFVTFFNAILMTPPRRQNEVLRHVMSAWDCLAPGGTLVAVVSPG
jgi:hypothetical protein